MTREEILALQDKNAAFRASKIGGLFVRFENLHSRAWQTDSTKHASDRRVRQDWDKSHAARTELVAAIEDATAKVASHADMLAALEEIRDMPVMSAPAIYEIARAAIAKATT